MNIDLTYQLVVVSDEIINMLVDRLIVIPSDHEFAQLDYTFTSTRFTRGGLLPLQQQSSGKVDWSCGIFGRRSDGLVGWLSSAEVESSDGVGKISGSLGR